MTTAAPMPTAGEPSRWPTRTGRRLGDMLLEAGYLEPAQLEHALSEQGARRRRLGEILREDGLIDEIVLAAALAVQLDSPLVDLRERASDDEALRLIGEEDARRLIILPLAADAARISFATEDPGDTGLIAEVARLSGRQAEPLLAMRQDIEEAITTRYRVTGQLAAHVSAFSTQQTASATPQLRQRLASLDELRGAPVVQIVNILVTQALRDRASDLHIEPQAQGLRIRSRVDGVLRDVTELPADLGPGLVSRIKILADLNIVEKQRAQDGQITMEIDGRTVDIRVATMRTLWGEKVVLRLLDRSGGLRRLDQLGFPAPAMPRYRELLDAPFGMILVTGPTGSGKTTTLYASVNELDRTSLNVTTIEDPIEYTFEDVNQTQVNPAAGITFASGLRAILRQDPDVILVGEMRDRETTEIAVQASLTGHLVLSSMHATDATGALLRVLEMGIEPFLVSASVTAVVAQRLMRRVCTHCRMALELTEEERHVYEAAGLAPPPTANLGRGCTYCAGSGYLDRIATYEVLRVTPEMRRLVARGGAYDEVRAQAIADGMVPMRADALTKAGDGLTSVPEAIRSVVAA